MMLFLHFDVVEATTLNERTFKLRPQDIFIRDNISCDDILVVSVGGNDVALMPCPCTILSILGLLSLPASCIEKSFAYGTVPVSKPMYCSMKIIRVCWHP